ncbi:MAG: sulfurtransferase TusA family protein [Proteobacteria bacterium]|nr:sulfurtransferase TusA family protein [Pseudomonadota bacterium]MBU1585216.1 sulfurtransferase TusA family protein [Pseudomonadota bacterium]MBU2454529.1 sulfurtransferase TusA family protein [Pseudomonadota bacterium]MBU2629106.1 sulfurtransferase TusA family protein [Pseudomonadota bacterium]
MSITIDARGFSCPQPVLMFMEAIKSGNESQIIVLVDTDASKENVSRAAESKQYKVSDILQQGDEYRMTIVKN